MSQPLVSIIVPVYNVEKYLEECFSSIIKQSYKNIEIILVDDGATDSSGKMADALAKSDARATVIHKKNGGLSDARNAGMKIAKGEYVTFVDSDDAIDKSFVKVLMSAAKKTGATIIQGDNSRDKDQLGNGSGDIASLAGKDAFVELIKFKVVSPTAWGKIYKTSLFRDNKLEFPVGRIHEDTAVLYKLIYHADIVVTVNAVLYFYRMNDNSIMTASYTKKHFDSVVRYHEELESFIAKHDISIDEKAVYKHKALRLLSVLNKMALHNQDKSEEFAGFKKDYLNFSVKSRSAVCMAGVIPASMPAVFRSIRNAMPVIRRVMGKV